MKNHTVKLFAGMIVLIAAVCLCVFANAAVVKQGYFGENNGLHWTLDDKGLLTVSGSGSMNGEHPWTDYWDKYPVKTAVINNGVKDLSKSAFTGCTKMTSVTIPESVKSISDHAFYRCESLTSVTLPGGLITIEDSAFMDCSSLSSISIPGSVTTIGPFAFDECGLTSFTVPDSVTEMGRSAFLGCASLQSFTFNSTMAAIPDSILRNCTSLTSVSVPANVTSIGYTSFGGCSALSAVVIENRDCAIAEKAFLNDDKLTLHGYRGSTAETYAETNGIPFESLDWIVSFNAGGGSGTMKEQSVVKGQKYTLPACAFTAPAGKEFDAWDKGAPGVKIDVTADTVITARWKDIPGAPDTGSDPAPGADPGSAPGSDPGSDPASDPGAAETNEQATLKKLKSVKLKAVSKKKIQVSWKKLSSKDRKKIKKIEIQVSTDPEFRTVLKTKFVSSKKTSYTVSGLAKNTKYFVRVRAYTEKDGVRYVSEWVMKNKKTKKK